MSPLPHPDQAQPREPEFNPQEPANTTVVAGESATLQCSGSSEVTPHIKVCPCVRSRISVMVDLSAIYARTSLSCTTTCESSVWLHYWPCQRLQIHLKTVQNHKINTYLLHVWQNCSNPEKEGGYLKQTVLFSLQWLRRIEEGSREADNIPDNQTLNWKGHRYVVLQATQVLTPGDGSFYTKVINFYSSHSF